MKYLQNLADWRGEKRAGGMARQQRRTLKWYFVGMAEWAAPHQRPELCPGHICWVGKGAGRRALLRPCCRLSAGHCLDGISLRFPPAAPITWVWAGTLGLFTSRHQWRRLIKEQIKEVIFWRVVLQSGVLVYVILGSCFFSHSRCSSYMGKLPCLCVTFLSSPKRFSHIFLLPVLNGPGDAFSFFTLLFLPL